MCSRTERNSRFWSGFDSSSRKKRPMYAEPKTAACSVPDDYYSRRNRRRNAERRPHSRHTKCKYSGKENRRMDRGFSPQQQFPHLQSTFTCGRLPPDLFISKILFLLPPQKIAQMRCVCNSWYVLLPKLLIESCYKMNARDLVLSGQQQPWLVMARFIRNEEDWEDRSRRDLVAYVPSLNRWLPFPLQLYSVPSLLGPGLQNTHPSFLSSFYMGAWYPMMASAGGFICSLIYNRVAVKEPPFLPYQITRFDKNRHREYCNYSSWASLLLFNPLTGRVRREPLPPNPLLRECQLSLSVVQVYNKHIAGSHKDTSSNSDSNCRYYVCLCPLDLSTETEPNPSKFMEIFDVQAHRWLQHIPNDGFEESILVLNNYISKPPHYPLVYSEWHLMPRADGVQRDIIRDADILYYVLNATYAHYTTSELYGYCIDRNMWMVADIELPPELIDGRHVVWKDSATRRVFLATDFRPDFTTGQLVEPYSAAKMSRTPSTCTGFHVWELKHRHGDVNFNRVYYWNHLSTTPSKFWNHPKINEHTNDDIEIDYLDANEDSFFITSGLQVSMTAVDYAHHKHFSGINEYPLPVRKQFPFGRYSPLLMYDILHDKWCQLPPPSDIPCCYGVTPVFAFQPSLDDTNLQ